MYCDLPKLEIWTYFVIWVSGVVYSLYNVYLAGNYYKYNNGGIFSPGWSFLNQKKDVSDFEWAIWSPFLCTAAPWVCVHLLVAEVVRYACKELLPIWYLTVSMLYLLQHVGLLATMSLAAEPCLMYLLLQLRSRTVVYIAGLFLLVLHNMDFRMNWMSLFYDQHYMLTISSAWIYMRSQSFCLDRLMSNKVSVSVAELVLLLGYCFYLPMLFLGPLVLFEEFEAGILKPYAPWTVQRMKIFLLNILRYVWWMCFLELFLHFIYVGALQMDLKHVRILGVWAHYGMGFSMGIMFQLKYVVTYGLSCTVARAEQIKAPAHPKCISRIHLYSDMWRHFDQGLYFFLRKYMYVPVLGASPSLARRLLASLVCFSFVYAWHKVFLFVLIWSALNYAGVSIEIICKAIGSTRRYQLCEKSLLSTPQNIRRFHAFIATPLFMMSALSNFYFFAGMEIGNHFLTRFFEGCEDEGCD
ncbi:protein-cysteine N-palmitoyltransferase Rasp-like [Periplaneta americana]|uniref:protein-cysteine N-palmitoyltransferase Rasp-like n=1 Tax=Periplaneta americana TaxID=6978 RepID=UPI0037E97AF7